MLSSALLSGLLSVSANPVAPTLLGYAPAAVVAVVVLAFAVALVVVSVRRRDI